MENKLESEKVAGKHRHTQEDFTMTGANPKQGKLF